MMEEPKQIADLLTARLTLHAMSDDSLDREERGLWPLLEGVTVSDWPPEHWEPHVFPFIRSQYRTHPETRGWHRYVIERAAPGEAGHLIGALGASPRPDGEVEFGYSIVPQFQRQGFGKEAACAFAAWLAELPETRSLTAQTYPVLLGSIRLMEACGLSFAGPGDSDGTVRYRRVL